MSTVRVATWYQVPRSSPSFHHLLLLLLIHLLLTHTVLSSSFHRREIVHVDNLNIEIDHLDNAVGAIDVDELTDEALELACHDLHLLLLLRHDGPQSGPVSDLREFTCITAELQLLIEDTRRERERERR